MQKLTPLIPGFYADRQGRIHLSMREFLAGHGLPDSPGLRAVIWEEMAAIFGEVEVIEISE